MSSYEYAVHGEPDEQKEQAAIDQLGGILSGVNVGEIVRNDTRLQLPTQPVPKNIDQYRTVALPRHPGSTERGMNGDHYSAPPGIQTHSDHDDAGNPTGLPWTDAPIVVGLVRDRSDGSHLCAVTSACIVTTPAGDGSPSTELGIGQIQGAISQGANIGPQLGGFNWPAVCVKIWSVVAKTLGIENVGVLSGPSNTMCVDYRTPENYAAYIEEENRDRAALGLPLIEGSKEDRLRNLARFIRQYDEAAQAAGMVKDKSGIWRAKHYEMFTITPPRLVNVSRPADVPAPRFSGNSLLEQAKADLNLAVANVAESPGCAQAHIRVAVQQVEEALEAARGALRIPLPAPSRPVRQADGTTVTPPGPSRAQVNEMQKGRQEWKEKVDAVSHALDRIKEVQGILDAEVQIIEQIKARW